MLSLLYIQWYQNGDKTAVSKTSVWSKWPPPQCLIIVQSPHGDLLVVGSQVPTKLFSLIGPPSGQFGDPRPCRIHRSARHHHVIHFTALLAPAAPVPPSNNLNYLTPTALQIRPYHTVLFVPRWYQQGVWLYPVQSCFEHFSFETSCHRITTGWYKPLCVHAPNRCAANTHTTIKKGRGAEKPLKGGFFVNLGFFYVIQNLTCLLVILFDLLLDSF